MAAKAKNGGSQGGNGNGPALHFEYVELRESEAYEMDGRVLDRLEEYPAYVEAVTGRRPTKSQVVEAALAQTFAADAGFQKHLRGSGKASSAASTAGAGTPRADVPTVHKNSKDSSPEAARPATV